MANLATRLFSGISNLFGGNKPKEKELLVMEKGGPMVKQKVQQTPTPTPTPTATPTPQPKRRFLSSFLKPSEPIVFTKNEPMGPPTPTSLPQSAPVQKQRTQIATPQPTMRPTPAPTYQPAPQPIENNNVGTGQVLGRSSKFKAAYNPQVEANVQIIKEAANKYGVPADLLLDIAAQESMLGAIQRTSGYHPTKRSASGLFQFVVPTWAAYAQRYANELGIDIPQGIAQASPWSDEWKNQVYTDEGLNWIDQYRLDPRINAQMAALIIRDGGLNNWEASRHSWGPNYKPEELSKYY